MHRGNHATQCPFPLAFHTPSWHSALLLAAIGVRFRRPAVAAAAASRSPLCPPLCAPLPFTCSQRHGRCLVRQQLSGDLHLREGR